MLQVKYLTAAVVLAMVLLACTTDKSDKNDSGAPSAPDPVKSELVETYKSGVWLTDRIDLNTLEEITITKSESLVSGPYKSHTDVYAVQGSDAELMTVSVDRDSEKPGTEPFILDMESSQWKSLPRPEKALNYLSSSNILTKDVAFFWGGEKQDGCAVIGGQLFDRKNAVWKNLPTDNAPSSRLYADIHTYQDSLLVFGGIKSHAEVCNDIGSADSAKFAITDGKFYSLTTGLWNGDITIPKDLIKDFDPESTSTWLIHNQLVVRLTSMEKSRILVMNLDTREWKSLLDEDGAAQQIQIAKLKDGLAVIHYKKSEAKDKPGTLMLTKFFGEALEKSSISEAQLPNVFNSIYVKNDASTSDGQNFLAIGLKSGDSIMDTSIQFAVDVSGPIRLLALPAFGLGLVEWMEHEGGYIGFSHDNLGKVIAIYVDKKSGVKKRLAGFDIKYDQYSVLRNHKNKIFLSMGLEKASNYVLMLPSQN